MVGVFDIGGTGYRTAISEDGYKVENISKRDTPRSYDIGIKSLVDCLKASGANKKFEKIAGAIAGKFDEEKSKLIFSPNLKNWENKLLKADLEQEFGCEVTLENDAVAEGIGEAIFGAGCGYSKVGYITAGTGIGGSIINVQGSKIKAKSIEPGWTFKIGDKYLEEVAGGGAMEKIYGKKPQDLLDVEIWKKEAEYLAVGINNIIIKWQPNVIVCNGSLFKSIDMIYLKSLVKKVVPLTLGTLQQEAGLYGCLRLLG